MLVTVPQKRRAGLATTRITNELVDAIRQCGQVQTGIDGKVVLRLIHVRVRVAAAATGGGWYTGFLRDMPVNVMSASANLSDTDLGANQRPCYIINAAERNQSTHDLTSLPVQTRDFVGHMLPQLLDELPIVEITGYDTNDCVV